MNISSLLKFALGAAASAGLLLAQTDITCTNTKAAFPTVPSKVTAAQKATILAEHTKIRTGSGVNSQLTWDDSLASFAQGWAEALATFNQKKITGNFPNWPHSTNSCYGKAHMPAGKYGENIGGGNGSPESAVQSWGAEKANFDAPGLTCKPGTVCDHYIQAVAARVSKVGCGKAPDSGWICVYDTIGAMKCSSMKYAPVFTPAVVLKANDKAEFKGMDGAWKPVTIKAVTQDGRLQIDMGGGGSATVPQPTGCPTDRLRAVK